MTHRLHLDRDVREEDLFSLALNWYPEASRDGATIHLTENSTLVFDPKAHAWDVHAPVQRDSNGAPEVPDGYGLNTAFADGMPIDEERDVLEFVLGAVRRLGGKLVTDAGKELSPHIYMLPGLTVVSPYLLSPQQTLEVVRGIVPEAQLAGETAETDGAQDAVPYSLSLPIFSEADLEVRVEFLEHEVPAISHVQWLQNGAVTYSVLFQPHDESSAVSTAPDKTQTRMWREAYLGCSAITKSLHDVVGGFVLDVDEFLVNGEALF